MLVCARIIIRLSRHLALRWAPSIVLALLSTINIVLELLGQVGIDNLTPAHVMLGWHDVLVCHSS